MKTVVILGITADIGRELASRFAREGWRVAGTHRAAAIVPPELAPHLLVKCELDANDSVDAAADLFRRRRLRWDLIVVAAGTEEPIGNFMDCPSADWERGISVNALAPLRFLRGLHDLRNPAGAHVAFFSGSGTNGPAPAYSAYCAAKILLVKMCELLDSESADTSFFILGPGIVRTKIHQQTLKAGARSGRNLGKVKDFLGSDAPGTSHEDIYHCLRWCVDMGKDVAGGRNFSVVNDEWRGGGSALASALKTNQDVYKLRRSGNERKFSAPAK